MSYKKHVFSNLTCFLASSSQPKSCYLDYNQDSGLIAITFC